MEMPIRRFHELPDSLLIHLLSFLDVWRAGGITSVLSKRLKRFCSILPTLEFGASWLDMDAPNFVPWGNTTDSYSSDVHVWLEFCVKNKMKILFLKFNTSRWKYYTLPQVMYSSSSLTTLHLIGCIMAYQGGAIQWNSLTDLVLFDVELNQHLLDKMLSSCPVLKNLELTSCSGFNRLEVNSERLNRLAIQESEDGPIVEISAPKIRSLDIRKVAWGRNSLHLRNVSSVVTASIDLFKLDGDDNSVEVEVMENVKYFLENFKHVNDLHIRGLYFQVVSKMAMTGWQLPQLRLQHLKIDSCSEHQLSISGMICLLDSSPNVETLFLNGFQTEEEGEEISDLHPAAKDDLESDLLHLKNVTFNNCADIDGEPLLTLASILLRRAPALQDMVIVVNVLETSDFVTIFQALLTYPRSSSNARIHLSRL